MKTTPILVLALVACLWGCTSTPEGHDTTLKETADSTSATAARDNTSAGAAVSAEQKASFAQLQVGMKDEKVRALLGKPSKVETINPEVGARVEDWWYGSNQKVRMTGGQVTRVVRDVAKEQETLQKINEARTKGDDAEAQRLLEELETSN